MKKEVELLYLQMLLSFLFIIVIFINILFSYNVILDLKGQKTLFTKKQIITISYYKGLLVVILAILFLYVNYQNKNIAIEKREDLTPFNMEIYASYFSIIAAFFLFYAIATNKDNIIADIENPII